MTTNRAFEIRSGYSHTLGANYDGEGVNFAIFSAHAERVELCLYDPSGEHEIARLELPEYTDEIWHGYVPKLQPGALYGYRVYGPYDPENGHRFNPNKLLIDPYARELVGDIQWNDAHFAYQLLHDDKDLTFDDQDSAPFTPKCRVIDPDEANWEDRQRPSIPWSNAIIYETHVKG
ncbi:glycogen debranching enzyme GlgX, partial [Salmonella enterica subsp. enterica serovar Typhimurium]|nr:glycogen debranching enzyme GlgX [Salmonella enterica subsp. enterica serovar Typhimurium]